MRLDSAFGAALSADPSGASRNDDFSRPSSGASRIEARGDQARISIYRDFSHISPFLRGRGLTGLGKHIVDPARSAGFSRLDNFVMEQLALGVLLTAHIGPFARREGGIEQYVSLQIVSVEICRVVKPLA